MKGGKRKAARRVREEGGISGRRRRACRGILTIPAVSGAKIPLHARKLPENVRYICNCKRNTMHDIIRLPKAESMAFLLADCLLT